MDVRIKNERCKRELIKYFTKQWDDNDKSVMLLPGFEQQKINTAYGKNKCATIHLQFFRNKAMSAVSKIFHLSNLNKIRLRTVLYIALFWTVIDFVIVLLRHNAEAHTKALWFQGRQLCFRESYYGISFCVQAWKNVQAFSSMVQFFSKELYPAWVGIYTNLYNSIY